MIHGTHKDDTLSALLWCVHSSHKLEVCGSRYYGDAHDSSDFDFVTEDESLLYLLNEGWRKSDSDKAGHLDRNTKHVLQRGRVQIIIANNLALRRAAGEWLIANGLNRHQTESWERAYGELSPAIGVNP